MTAAGDDARARLAADRRAYGRVEDAVRYVLGRGDARARRVWRRADGHLRAMFGRLALPPLRRRLAWWTLRTVMLLSAWRGRSLSTIEGRLRSIMRRRGSPSAREAAARERAGRMLARLEPHLAGTRLLDLGGGNGLLAAGIRASTDLEVTLADVLDYRMTDEVPLVTLERGAALPFGDRAFDTVVLYLVLHHTADPDGLLAEAARVCARRLVVMEGDIDGTDGDGDLFLLNAFLDWFLNRVVQRAADMDLPLTFRTDAEWRAAFDRLGLEVTHAEALGVDEPLAPEHHRFYVLDRR